MTIEQQLKDKTFYKMFINEHEDIHPIQVLGDAFQEEAQKDLPDLTRIRFAQGEVYFHHKDYEAAIFKWESIINELEPWARKNTADAYYELGMLSTAEDIYTAIEIDNPTLSAEVALKLFSLYLKREKIEAAISTIKKAIDANPDYPNLTVIAREFFEQRGDWENAIELAVNEAKRTGSPEWFETLKSYVNEGVTKGHAPSYFSQALVTLFSLDLQRFEELAASLWNSYRNENSYYTWLLEINHLLMNLELEKGGGRWLELSRLHKETYFSYINGGYLIKQLQDFIPDLLTNWVRLAAPVHVVLASAAVLSWNELFPASLSMTIVEEAERLISVTETDIDELEECLTLFESITEWASSHDLGENNRMKWVVDQLVDFDTQHVIVAGLGGSGKSSFINAVLGEDLQDSPTSSVVLFKHAEETEISEITDEEITKLSGFSEFQERMDRLRNALESIIEFKQPNQFLQNNKLAFIDTPGLKGNHQDSYDVLKYLQVADTVLFVMDAKAPFTDKERVAMEQIQVLAPDIPVHFLLTKMDTIVDEHEAQLVVEETKSAIREHLPDALVFACSSQSDRTLRPEDVQQFIGAIKNTRNLVDKRLAKLLYFIRTTIATLLQKRLTVENQLIETVRWNEEMNTKLNGAAHQLNDTVVQKSRAVSKIYHEIKEKMEAEIFESVPKVLRECSSLIQEDSNFSTIHLNLNHEMNNRLQDYVEQQVMPMYYHSLLEWLKSCRAEFTESQENLLELGDAFNQMYGEEYLKLECDFKVLDDWRRDIDRLTSRFQLESVNILLKRTPSQFLLKSAGKLFGALSQNKSMVYNKYKSFVEGEDYLDVAKEVSRQFFQPFELFEKSLERDIGLFFKSPLAVLNRAVAETRSEAETNQEILRKLNTNPELFRDPLTLFELRLRQFEWITVAGKGMQTVY
ncbi:dynamin family protein [Bacillus sp. FJAT-29814]|uniref:dynamin family protein n=1 Tax=Bacillus sp. FJAT-29814 TaxID=1729688 RepID=UPI000836A7D5|nr:dynamin family protein [Bacillus sp. FJAT-29814]